MKSLVRRLVTNYFPDLFYRNLIIYKAARFVACEMIEGDYLEFGTFQGGSFIDAYKCLELQFRNRVNQPTGGEEQEKCKRRRNEIWSKMRFFGFDSFEGLPALSGRDQGSEDFKKGMYACSEQSFINNVTGAGVPKSRIIPVKGWFEDTCVPATQQKYNMKKAAIIWIDGDLYSSTVSNLEFITPMLQDGTVLIFDDWFTHKGSPFRGEQRAFHEWTDSEEIKDQYVFNEYQREGWARMSFITSKQ